MTHLQYCEQLLGRIYHAVGPQGTAQDKDAVLYELTDFMEEEVRSMGGQFPPQPNYFGMAAGSQ